MSVVLKPVLENPQPCTFCMSPSSITPDSTHQLISGDCKTRSGCVRYRETYKMCSAGGTSWRGLRTTVLCQRTPSCGPHMNYTILIKTTVSYNLPNNGRVEDCIFKIPHTVCIHAFTLSQCTEILHNVLLLQSLTKCSLSLISKIDLVINVH